MSAIVVAVLCGAWAARILAVIDLLILALPGDIFGGLGRLDVAAVGHVAAAATAAACTAAIMVRRGRRPPCASSMSSMSSTHPCPNRR
jgi:hypothetical protein